MEDDVNGITSIDGNGDVIWMISGEGMNNLPTAEKLDYVPVDGQIIYFFAVVFETADEGFIKFHFHVSHSRSIRE